MPEPCRDRDITIEPAPNPVQVLANGEVVAQTAKGLLLNEAGYPARLYVPISDVTAELLLASEHSSHCPFKGDAAYHHLKIGETTLENAVWYYDDPCPLVGQVKDHLAFWGDAIEIRDLPQT